jgi:hypothetical protein
MVGKLFAAEAAAVASPRKARCCGEPPCYRVRGVADGPRSPHIGWLGPPGGALVTPRGEGREGCELCVGPEVDDSLSEHREGAFERLGSEDDAKRSGLLVDACDHRGRRACGVAGGETARGVQHAQRVAWGSGRIRASVRRPGRCRSGIRGGLFRDRRASSRSRSTAVRSHRRCARRSELRIGSPSEVRPAGMAAADWPVTFQAWQWGIHGPRPIIVLSAPRPSQRSFSTAGDANGGVGRTSISSSTVFARAAGA